MSTQVKRFVTVYHTDEQEIFLFEFRSFQDGHNGTVAEIRASFPEISEAVANFIATGIISYKGIIYG